MTTNPKTPVTDTQVERAVTIALSAQGLYPVDITDRETAAMRAVVRAVLEDFTKENE